MGTTLEFRPRDAQLRLEDMVGGGPFGLRPGGWTDDTSMALALADSLSASETLDCRDLMDRFVRWWRHGDYSHTGDCFDIGNTTLDALDRYKQTGDPLAGSTDPRSAGNGSLMRLAPVALRFWNDRPRLIAAAANQSRTTHGAEEAVDACLAFAELLADAIAGSPRADVLAPRPFEGAEAIASIMAGSWRGRARGHDQLQRVRRGYPGSRHLGGRPHRRLPQRGAARRQPGRRRGYGRGGDGPARRRPSTA